MRESGKRIRHMEKAFTSMQIKGIMMGNFLMTSTMEKGFANGQTEIFMKGHGKMIK
jgi:hypothetical protein